MSTSQRGRAAGDRRLRMMQRRLRPGQVETTEQSLVTTAMLEAARDEFAAFLASGEAVYPRRPYETTTAHGGPVTPGQLYRVNDAPETTTTATNTRERHQ